MAHKEKNEKAGKNGRVKAVAYLRTSSAANVGADKDSEKRQRAAIKAYAKSARFEIADEDWFYDPAVSGADPIETRPGFNRLLDRIEGNGVRVVIVEDASRFARDLITQELGILSLIKLEVRVVTASGDELTDTSDPMKVAMRQIAGAFAELEKKRLVAKLKGARERKRLQNAQAKGEERRVTLAGRGKCEGRKNVAEIAPEAVKLARELNDGRSLRTIAAELEAKGFKTRKGTRYSADAVKRMLGAGGSKSRALTHRDAKGRRLLWPE
jgi:DNA invertase Pin-like site-specific DNA recombinase